VDLELEMSEVYLPRHVCHPAEESAYTISGRLVRLIPTEPASSERTAITNLFNHRLSSNSAQAASEEWQSLIAGTSPLWSSIPSSKKQLIRSFFNLLNLEILKRSRPPLSTFDFTSASVGNLFLTGARLFSGSFESAIYLLGSITGVPNDLVHVIPAINSNFTHHIAAGLANGSVIVGQNSISHPSEPTALEIASSPLSPGSKNRRSRLSLGDPEAALTDADNEAITVDDAHGEEEEEDANLPGSLPTLRTAAIKFSKTSTDDDLPSRIERIWYINPYGQEISPPPNPRVCEAVRSAQAIIYSIGSLYTSIIPSIILRGVGQAIRRSPAATRQKILILNGSFDREIGPGHALFTALDFVEAIVRAGEESQGIPWKPPPPQASNNSFSTTASSSTISAPSSPYPSTIFSTYVTHLIHLSGPSTPYVDRPRLRALGIETLKLYGRRIEAPDGPGGKTVLKGMRYDPAALTGALETILGRRGAAVLDCGGGRGGGGDGGDGVVREALKSRRNTLEA
jgi:2-phospho-L-lactate transferase/gluconeogenesis factor (CofD/UPF0052 family)